MGSKILGLYTESLLRKTRNTIVLYLILKNEPGLKRLVFAVNKPPEINEGTNILIKKLSRIVIVFLKKMSGLKRRIFNREIRAGVFLY